MHIANRNARLSLMLAFFGFGKKAPPLGYNKGVGVHPSDTHKSDQALQNLDGNDHAAEEVKAAGSPAYPRGVAVLAQLKRLAALAMHYPQCH